VNIADPGVVEDIPGVSGGKEATIEGRIEWGADVKRRVGGAVCFRAVFFPERIGRFCFTQLVLFGACMLAPGCASTNQANIKFLETRELDMPYSAAYDAALNAVFSMGLSITHTDKGSGVISAQSGDHAQRATMGAIARAFHPVKKVTLMVRPRSDAITQLRMKVLINEEQQLDRKLMTEIWQRIEREAMLDAGPDASVVTRRRDHLRRTKPNG